MAKNLPEEIITSILTRLPVKPLLRFRSLSKHYKSLIDSPPFIKRHLSHSLSTKSHRHLILQHNRLHSINLSQTVDRDKTVQPDGLVKLSHPVETVDRDKTVKPDRHVDGLVKLSHPVETVDRDKTVKPDHPVGGLVKLSHPVETVDRDKTVKPDHPVDWLVKLSHPVERSDVETEVIGAVNGLVCLYNGDKEIVIWNMATRRCEKVPVERIEFPGYECYSHYVVYGFGYDSVSDDYKLLRLVHFFGDGSDTFDSEAKVYSLGSNSWQRIQDFTYYLRYLYKKNQNSLFYREYRRGYSVLVSSALHWIGASKHEINAPDVIIAFDLATNKYRQVDQPKFSKKGFHMTVGELEGCLCLMCEVPNERVDVWVMKVYGVRASWSKLLSISQPEVIQSFEFVTPLAYSKRGDKIMMAQDNKKLLWYFVKERRVKMINLRGCPEHFEPVICVESLVRLRGKAGDYAKKQVGAGAKRKQVQHGKKKRDDFLSHGFKLKL